MPLINTHVLMSDADNFSTLEAINPYYHEDPLDVDKAIREHESIYSLMQQAEITVTKVPSPTDSQDGVYTANWALIRGDVAILARLPGTRRAEEDYAEKILSDLGKTVIHVPDGLKFSGQGDALACGDYLFCGSTYRSDVAAQIFAAETLGYTRIQLQTVPQLGPDSLPVINSISGWADSFFYDIDLALAVIMAPTETTKGLIAYCPEAFTPESQALLLALDAVEKIEVSLIEAQAAFATNLVSTGETVIMSAHAPNLANALQSRGLTILSPDITELAKGGGYIRCTTLTLT